MSRGSPVNAGLDGRISRRALMRGMAGLGASLSVAASYAALARPATAAPFWRSGHIALAAGHHNMSSGNPVEIELVGPITREIARACRARYLDVRVVTPDEGLGVFHGRLSDVARRVVDWDRAGWPVDLFLEVHAEGNQGGNGSRGCFVIYPDTDDDVDIRVRDELGPALIHRLSAATGIPLRGDGLMSERETAVGARGRRLGVLRSTLPIRAHCTRLLVEVGATTSPLDLAIMQRPDFAARAAEAIATTFAAFCPPRPVAGLDLHMEW